MFSSKMTKSGLWNRLVRGAFLAGTAAVLLFITTPANASCGDPGKAKSGIVTPLPFLRQANAAPNSSSASIVGVWHVTYTMSDGGMFYEAFDIWHSDGAEFEVANLPPAAGNVCMGVWTKAGPAIQLDHIGWAFDMNGNSIGTFTLTEENVVNGNTYTGTFDYKAYDVNGNPIPDQEVKGTLKATRIH
jgi:hypothetical protein